MKFLGIAIMFMSLIPADIAYGQQLPHMAASRMETPPVIDGRIEDGEWPSEVATRFVQREPVAGAAATQASRAHIAYDDGSIYVALRMEDSAADSISAPLSRRDAASDDSDWAYVMLDPDGDGRTASVFAVNPRGVQKDWAVVDDAREDLSWDAVWHATASIDSAGWSAEIKIPLSQLRFDTARTSWRLNVGRWIARKREYSFWAAWPRREAGYVSRFGVLDGMTATSSPQRLEILPYVSAQMIHKPVQLGNPYSIANTPAAKAGVDLKIRLTPTLTLNSTVNPDFGQVEGDPAVVNLTAFETRFTDRRPFFIEGGGYFNYEGGELFYSRRLGRRPQMGLPSAAEYADVPQATTILAAAKLSGRNASGWSIGVLSAITAEERARITSQDGIEREIIVEPWTHYFVGRATKDLASGRTTIGGISTQTVRIISDSLSQIVPTTATVVGLDLRHRINDEIELRHYTAGSSVSGNSVAITRLQRSPARHFQRPDADHVSLDENATTLNGFLSGLRLAKVSGNWRWDASAAIRSVGFEINDLGFQSEADRISQRAQIQYLSFDPKGALRQWDIKLIQSRDWTTGGENVDGSATLYGNFELSNYWSGFAQLLRRFPALSTTALRGGPAIYTPGYTRPAVYLRTDRRKNMNASLLLNARIGDDSEDRGFELESTVEVRNPTLRLSVSPGFEWIRYPWQYVTQSGGLSDRAYLFGRLQQKELSLGARVSYVFTPRLSLEGFAQPFINVGRYDKFLSVASARDTDPTERFQPAEAPRHLPNFTVRSLRSNAVLRWEYAPGNSVYVAWTQERASNGDEGELNLAEMINKLSGAEATHVLLIKASFWLNL